MKPACNHKNVHGGLVRKIIPTTHRMLVVTVPGLALHWESEAQEGTMLLVTQKNPLRVESLLVYF